MILLVVRTYFFSFFFTLELTLSLGVLEATILKSYMRASNIRRWLRRPDCPAVIREFKRLFELSFVTSNRRAANFDTDDEANFAKLTTEPAHFKYDGTNYSRASTHLGNSIVLFYPPNLESEAVAGSIQKIEVAEDGVHFWIQRQKPLAQSKHDPFSRFPSYLAKTYSSSMSGQNPERIPIADVLGHAARFEFSDGRAVIVDLSRVYFPYMMHFIIAQ